MDYIREELLRQQRALAALMMGGEPLVPAEAGQEAALYGESVGLEADGNGARVWNGREREAFSAPVSRTRSVGWGKTERAQGEPDAAGAVFGAYGHFLGRVEPQRGRAGRAGTLQGAAWSGHASGAAGGLPAEATAPREAEAFAASGGDAADARALSQMFQRDARRYDGGFSLY